MATKTPNLGLTKPDPSDYYNIDVFNENADKIDAVCAPGTPVALADSPNTPSTTGTIFVFNDTLYSCSVSIDTSSNKSYVTFYKYDENYTPTTVATLNFDTYIKYPYARPSTACYGGNCYILISGEVNSTDTGYILKFNGNTVTKMGTVRSNDISHLSESCTLAAGADGLMLLGDYSWIAYSADFGATWDYITSRPDVPSYYNKSAAFGFNDKWHLFSTASPYSVYRYENNAWTKVFDLPTSFDPNGKSYQVTATDDHIIFLDETNKLFWSYDKSYARSNVIPILGSFSTNYFTTGLYVRGAKMITGNKSSQNVWKFYDLSARRGGNPLDE